MLQKANELCAEVRSLGAALLSAYEKRDGEELARLRSAHEQRLLEAMKDIRQKQVEEALETKASLEKTKAVITERQLFYSTRQFMNAAESTSMLLGALSSYLGLIANGLSTGGASAALIPEFTVGVAGMAGSPTTLASTGGRQASNVAGSWSKAFELLSSYTNLLASLTGTMGNYSRRWEEWQLQKKLADKELEQIDKQITAADIRHTIALKEQENHELQRTHAQEVADHLRGKFSHQELYNWMVSELSSLYFQSYQLAYDTARRAERAYRHERGLAPSSFIRFGQWDSLRQGLLAGEGLQLDLRRLEMAYLHEHRRDHELTRHVSLLSLNPLALILLKETGSCEFTLPEWLFDLDHPGHYMRRIKSVSLSLPCVVGPYTNVNAKLTLVSNKVRISPDAGESYAETLSGTDSDPRFRQDFVSTQSIATSTGQNDSGLFELNFRDERYLPFEGAGVISTWRLELSGKWREVQWPQFDFQTIADAILHLRYTARDGGDTLKTRAISSLNAAIQGPTEGEPSGLNRLFSLRHEFPTEWQRFKASTDTPASFQCRITPDRFPYFLQGKTIQMGGSAVAVYQVNQVDPLPASVCTATVGVDPSPPGAWDLSVQWVAPWDEAPLPTDLFVLLRYALE
jgi:hypothetical protein